MMGGQILKLRSEELREEGREEGQMELLKKLVQSGEMSLQKAVEYAQMTVEQFNSYGKQLI